LAEHWPDQATHWSYLSNGSSLVRGDIQHLGTNFRDNQTWLIGDFNGDDLDDVAQMYADPNSETSLFVYHSDGGLLNRSPVQRLEARFADNHRWIVGDFNGDSLDDLVLVYGHRDHGATAWIYASNGSGFDVIARQRLDAGFWEAQRWRSGDFNGDGLDDLVLVYGHAKHGATAWIYTSNGSSFEITRRQRLGAGFWETQRWQTGDFNGDGLDDLLLVYGHAKHGATAWIYTSNGSSFEKTRQQRLDAGFWEAQRWETGDFNGDAFDDLVLVYGHAKHGATAWIYTANGDGFDIAHRQRLKTEFWDTQRWLMADLDGNGLHGLALFDAHKRVHPSLPPLASAESAIVIDQSNGRVLGARQPDVRRPMASTTKIMTGLLVVERIAEGTLELGTIVTVSQNAGSMGDVGQGSRAGGSVMGDINGAAQDSSVGLSPDDTVSIQDLLYGLLLDSGNDAALALAEAVAESEAAFVDLMNTRAAELGLQDTYFANAHGRDPQKVDPDNCPQIDFEDPQCAHYSTARDLARLARTALAQPLFATVVGTRRYETRDWSAQDSANVDSDLDNGNFMIRTDRADNSFLYPNAFGVKTGTTERAGRCLVSAAKAQSPASDSLIAVVLGAANNADRYEDSAIALDHGFETLAAEDAGAGTYAPSVPGTGTLSP
jgi:D-alanyl-D-alanine carboxypeptidase